MRMYEKLKTLKDKLQKMKSNRANRQTGQTFHFSPFSRKQKQVLTWWCKESPVHDMDGVIADGAIRSGKTISMTIIQEAMSPWEHGIDYQDVQKLYDAWIDEGNSQLELYQKILIPLMVVSGFLPEKTAASLLEEIENA